MNTKLVTVIIPTHNYGHLISEAIDSVLNQTYQNIELIVVDDGSTDNTSEIIKKYPNIEYIYQKHIGKKTPSRASNTGIKQSHGEYIICLGADDKLVPTYVEECVKEIERDSKIGFVWTGCLEFGLSNTTRMPRAYHHRFSVLRNPQGQLGAMLVRKEAYDEVGGYDTSLDCTVDWDMAIRLSLAGWKGKSISKVLSLCRIHKTNIQNVELRKNRLRQLERKYWMMKPYTTASRIFDIAVLALKSPESFLVRLWNKGVTKIFKVQRLKEPPTNYQHRWVNEKSVIQKITGDRILDCGCGVGRWGYLLKNKKSVVGFDLSKEALKKAKEHESVVMASATALPFPPKVFDASLAAEVVEHLSKEDGCKFLRELKKVTKKRVIVTTPKNFEPIYYGANHPQTHRSLWTRKEINDCLR